MTITKRIAAGRPLTYAEVDGNFDELAARIAAIPGPPDLSAYALKANQLVNVKDAPYNAKGDGVTDDRAAIQAAFDATPGGTVFFPAGVYMVGGTLNWPVSTSIQGAGLSSTTIKLKSGVNASLIQTAGYSGLTGGSTLGGTFNVQMSDLTLDGNKAGNTAGNGIQIYGKAFRLINLRIQNAAGHGLITEYLGGDDFTTPAKTLEATLMNLSVQQNGGSGIVSRGPHDLIANNIISFSNGQWGWDVQTSVNAHHVNTYVNGTGGIWVHYVGAYVGCLNGSGIVGSNGTGWGALLEAGGNNITASSFAGPIGLEIRANNNNIHGVIGNSTTGVKIVGPSANCQLMLTIFGVTGYWFDISSAGGGGNSVIAYSGDTSGTLFSPGTPPGTWIVSGTKAVTYIEGEMYAKGGVLPGTPAGAIQPNVHLYAGVGAPNNADGRDGGYYFRSDPPGGGARIYFRSGGVWGAIL